MALEVLLINVVGAYLLNNIASPALSIQAAIALRKAHGERLFESVRGRYFSDPYTFPNPEFPDPSKPSDDDLVGNAFHYLHTAHELSRKQILDVGEHDYLSEAGLTYGTFLSLTQRAGKENIQELVRWVYGTARRSISLFTNIRKPHEWLERRGSDGGWKIYECNHRSFRPNKANYWPIFYFQEFTNKQKMEWSIPLRQIVANFHSGFIQEELMRRR